MYSPLGHNHAGDYAAAAHDHDGQYDPIGSAAAVQAMLASYALATHHHDGVYAAATHNHDLAYAELTHHTIPITRRRTTATPVPTSR